MDKVLPRKNVISLNCVVDMEMMNAAFTDFIDNVTEAGYTPVGNIFLLMVVN